MKDKIAELDWLRKIDFEELRKFFNELYQQIWYFLLINLHRYLSLILSRKSSQTLCFSEDDWNR